MKENQEKIQYKNELELKDLVLSIWNRRKFIILITLIFAILAGVSSKLLLLPKYNTKLNIIISMPEKYTTKYGEYIMPIKSNEQYINLITSNNVLLNVIDDMGYKLDDVTLENLQNRITIGSSELAPGQIQNSYEVTVSATSPEESLKLGKILFDNYIEFMDIMTKEMAVNYYYDNFTVQLKSLEALLNSNKKILEKNEELLRNTPIAYNETGVNFEIQSELTSSSDYVIPVNTINPNYIKIENDIIANKQTINSIENSIRIYNDYISEIDMVKQSIAKYYETGEVDSVKSSIIGVVETSIYLPSQPIAPSYRTSPNYILIVLVGTVIGGMVGVITSWVKEFWF